MISWHRQSSSLVSANMSGFLHVTQICRSQRCMHYPFQSCCSWLSLVMSLTRLRTLRLKLDSSYPNNRHIRLGDLSQLRGHSSLQEVHLLGLADEDCSKQCSVSPFVPLTKCACSFFGMQQLKVLSMAYIDLVEVASYPFSVPQNCKRSEAPSACIPITP